jgi:hypothetical protein
MQTSEVTTLYRPVGPKELELIRQSGWKKFPPRLPEQPIFYPVMNEDYAVQIARDWNVPASGSGYVTKFKVRTDYVKKFEVQMSAVKFTMSFGYQQKNWKNSIATSFD